MTSETKKKFTIFDWVILISGNLIIFFALAAILFASYEGVASFVSRLLLLSLGIYAVYTKIKKLRSNYWPRWMRYIKDEKMITNFKACLEALVLLSIMKKQTKEIVNYWITRDFKR